MKSIIFYLGQAWQKWDWRSLDTTGIGGSETAAINMARELSLLGYKCKIFADVSENSIDPQSGTEYINYKEWESYALNNQIDTLICSRNLVGLIAKPRANKIIGWIHDITISCPPQYLNFLDIPDSYFVLTKWHYDYVHHTQKIPKNKLIITSNGVDPNRFKMVHDAKKDRFSTFYSSSPERGLERLIDAIPAIRQHIPDFKLHVCNDFEVAESWISIRGTQEQKDMLQRLKKKINSPGIIYHGKVNQNELAKIQMQAGMWLYPTDFPETSCITAMEAGFAMCPIVTNPIAGLYNTAGGSAIFLQTGTLEEFVAETVKLCLNNEYYEYWQNMAYQGMQRYTWASVANQWNNIL